MSNCDYCCSVLLPGINCGCAADETVRALRAKLQAAEERLAEQMFITSAWRCEFCGLVVPGNQYHDCKDQTLRSRAEAAEAEVGNLASLVRILVHSLRKVNPNSSNIIRAMDYLKRKGLTGSILRDDEPQPQEIPESGGHIESADCWCGPTVEEHLCGTLIIHNQTH